jgi:hypothetical protein
MNEMKLQSKPSSGRSVFSAVGKALRRTLVAHAVCPEVMCVSFANKRAAPVNVALAHTDGVEAEVWTLEQIYSSATFINMSIDGIASGCVNLMVVMSNS